MAKLQFEVVADELSVPEGPVWMTDGSVIIVELTAGKITRIFPDGTKHVVATPGGGPNGAAIGPDGKLYVCNSGGFPRLAGDPSLPRRPSTAVLPRSVNTATGDFILAPGATEFVPQAGRIERIDLLTGAVERLYAECNGRALVCPNDIVFDKDGGFWFTDIGKTHATARDHGGLFYARADGSFITRAVDRIDGNGVGLSPDGRTVYVALTDERQLLAFDKLGPGRVAPAGNHFAGNVVASLPGRQCLDSLAVMADGRIAQAVVWESPGIAVIDPASGAVDRFHFPDTLTTNICFGGPDVRDAWVTLSESGRLVRLRWESPGLQLNYYAE
jgi:gluconolactonase